MGFLFCFSLFIHISHALRVPCGRGRGPRGPDVISGHGRGRRGLRTFAATITDGYSNASQLTTPFVFAMCSLSERRGNNQLGGEFLL